MNTLTGAWCRFTGWNANCFALYNNSLFFGGNTGQVRLGYVGLSDVADPISMSIKNAFNYYDDPGRQKIIQMIKPYIIADGDVFPTTAMDVDFEDVDFIASVSPYTIQGARWDAATSLWDSTTWFSGNTGSLINDWDSAGAIGTAIALRLKINVLDANVFNSGDSLFDSGLFDSAVFDVGGVYTESGENLPILRINSFQVIMEHGAPVG
jgi:hypothetical protein